MTRWEGESEWVVIGDDGEHVQRAIGPFSNYLDAADRATELENVPDETQMFTVISLERPTREVSLGTATQVIDGDI